ncbi:hypothetical protein LWI29_024784 [Acer saccharum]|uniref:Myb/SANT-like domain-containing protein n=1 Tax=Acer saccharum TaxID=4024 RepID=A0AA39VGP2_ACESA|nr:hypothetical protein LWI29_024784 [Acer saccharum]
MRICVDETLVGNRPNGHFNKVGWKSIINKFVAMNGRNYTYKQFKNKWDSLKKDWQIWTNLTGKEIGLGWDPMKQTIDASDEWWIKKLKKKGVRNKIQDLDLILVHCISAKLIRSVIELRFFSHNNDS